MKYYLEIHSTSCCCCLSLLCVVGLAIVYSFEFNESIISTALSLSLSLPTFTQSFPLCTYVFICASIFVYAKRDFYDIRCILLGELFYSIFETKQRGEEQERRSCVSLYFVSTVYARAWVVVIIVLFLFSRFLFSFLNRFSV